MITKAVMSPVLRGLVYFLLTLSLLAMLTGLVQIVRAQIGLAAQNTFLQAADRHQAALADVETSYRGYVITASESYLQPYREAADAIGSLTNTLEQTAAAAGIPDQALTSIKDYASALFGFAEEVTTARNTSFELAKGLINTNRGKQLMDGVRSNTALMHNMADATITRLTRQQYSLWLPVALAGLVGTLMMTGLILAMVRRSRDASVRARSLLTDVLDRAPVGLALIDQNNAIQQQNPAFARLMGRSASALVGAPMAAVVPELHQLISPRMTEALAFRRIPAQGDEDKPFEIDTPEGTKYFKAEVFPVTLVDNEGRHTAGAGLVLSDLTRQREGELLLEQARDEAQSANRAKSAFIANMSHELRTPLTAVLGYCELIEEELRDKGEEAILSDLNKIGVNARHLLGLINDVLDLSKVEAQKMDVHAVDFTVATLLDEVEAATGSLMMRNNNRLALAAADRNHVLSTDDLKVKQILLNLIGNAAKFTRDGEITLSVSHQQQEGKALTRLEVSDNGIGMTAEQVDNLFKRFTQADETTTRKYGGTGLGLALTRALAIMLGGEITVESTPGVGSRFVVTIPSRYEKPVATVAEAGPENAPATAAPLARSTRGTVLVVDDEASARDLLQRHLSREGFSVVTAATGAEALDKLKTGNPAAVLLDVMMPGMDGWHVLRAIRQNPATRTIPVIMQTVLDEQHFAYTLGASGYLQKPVKRPQLAEALASVLASHDGKSVLIVDDDAAANSRLKTMFEKQGWRVRLARDGAEGLDAMVRSRPSLVLVDLIMPGMNGYEFVRQVRAHDEWSAIPLVVMTAEDVKSAKVRTLAPAAKAIVQKGAMSMADLVADLRRFVDQPPNPPSA
jgi:PAS domain S-box-containing protein